MFGRGAKRYHNRALSLIQDDNDAKEGVNTKIEKEISFIYIYLRDVNFLTYECLGRQLHALCALLVLVSYLYHHILMSLIQRDLSISA